MAALEVDISFHVAGPGSLQVRASLRVDASITAIMGPSGSGKSSLLAALAGLRRIESGTISLDGTMLADATKHLHFPPHLRRVALVHQSQALFPHMTCLANVAYGIPRIDPSREQTARQWLQRLRVAHVANQRPASISGGEAQRVALARALASQPRALLLDEPLSALDDELRDGLRSELKELLLELSMPVLLVTHDRRDADAMAASVIRMRGGTVPEPV